MDKLVEPKTLSGFMELMPSDQILFDEIKSTIEKVYKLHGFYPLDTPIIESSEVLLAKAGGETEKQIYRFNKADNDLSLRFDLTVPLAKYVASRYNELVFPFKRYQIGKVYRGERAQKGRYREFYQSDIDVIGLDELSISYDALMPKVIYDIFKRLDFGKFVICINNRKILTGFFEYLNLSDKITEILRTIDKIKKIGLDSVKQELYKLNISSENIEKIIDFISIKDDVINNLRNLNIENEMFNEGVNELENVLKLIEDYNIDKNYYKIDLTISRGLDYYTGTVYETFLVDYPSIGSICSGGRYDNLAGFYTNQKLPGVGISIGLTRLFYQLNEAGIIKSKEISPSKIAVLPMTDNMKYVNNFTEKLINNNISIDIVYLDKFKKLMKYADRNNFSYALIIGDEEIEKNVAILKDMESGNQKEVTIDSIVSEINK